MRRLFSSKYQIFHVHWPVSYVLKVPSASLARRRYYLFLFAVRIMKLMGKKMVWTVHNLDTHENLHAGLSRKLTGFLYRNIDGFITLNEDGIGIIKSKRKSAKQQIAHIPHPHYIGYYANTLSRNEARNRLGISDGEFVFLFLGYIKPYKNVASLVKAFLPLAGRHNVRLLVAGFIDKDVNKAELEHLAQQSDRVSLFNQFVEDDEIQIYLNACDLAVTPYTKIFNSGTLFLNLSFGKPTLAPNVYAIKEVKALTGSKWVKTYEGEINENILKMAMNEVLHEQREAVAPALTQFDPAQIARETLSFYKKLLAAPGNPAV